MINENGKKHIKVNIPGFKEFEGDKPIVILGPNGSGKTRLAQKITDINQVSPISAQRRTWINDNLPVQDEHNLRNNIRETFRQWIRGSWLPTEEIDFVLSDLIQEHTEILTKRNEEAIASEKLFEPVTDTRLILIQQLWKKLFPILKLEIGGYFPKVKRQDINESSTEYKLKEMSDGERTVLYMAARILTAENPIILVDEPELHMHSKLAVQFWDEVERLRNDCRFIYITHDLHFALSRKRAIVLIAQDGGVQEISMDQIASSIAAEVLGVATLPFYAQRIFLYEGELGTGFANEFFSVWFADDTTFAIPCGNRDSVCAAVSGLKTIGVSTAEIIGLIDRDYYSDAALESVTNGVKVLSLHEIESILCDQKVVSRIAEHLGKDPSQIWEKFLDRIRSEFKGQTLNNMGASLKIHRFTRPVAKM